MSVPRLVVYEPERAPAAASPPRAPLTERPPPLAYGLAPLNPRMELPPIGEPNEGVRFIEDMPRFIEDMPRFIPPP